MTILLSLQEAVLDYLEGLEDLRLAKQELIEYRAGRSTAVSLEELVERHRLEA